MAHGPNVAHCRFLHGLWLRMFFLFFKLLKTKFLKYFVMCKLYEVQTSVSTNTILLEHILICVDIIGGCFCTGAAEPSSWDRALWHPKPKIFAIWSFTETVCWSLFYSPPSPCPISWPDFFEANYKCYIIEASNVSEYNSKGSWLFLKNNHHTLSQLKKWIAIL